MTDLKNKQVFNETLVTSLDTSNAGQPSGGYENEGDASKELNAHLVLNKQQTFESPDSFSPMATSVEDESPELELEQLIKPQKRTKGLAVALFIAFSGLLGWQAVDAVVTAISASDWLSLGWAALISGVSLLGLSAIGKELWKLRKLRHHFSTQEESHALIQEGGIGKARSFCTRVAKESGLSDENPSFDKWKNCLTASHSDAEVIELYESIVVKQFDQKAAQIVTKHACESAVLVAVSPLALADMALVAWRNLKMIDSLAALYGVELGYWSRLSLFKMVLINMAAAGASELAVDASMDLLSMDLAGKLSARAGQGIGVGILSARVGLKAIALLRPMAWHKENALTLSTIRKQIVSKVAAISIK
ncbi:YcjF family protein [Vibrio genomosp. F10]|uniref:YcjF family protein n=1 Tax=Vibrio genomosp. F10 TaxID=723171 RepID=UPI0002FAC23D|nr:TIGR01620 family protein [Vibrio genomosp. F10]OEF03909.1 TIGR01620 family protein [Vibrio genomosp. F10 str. 9ZB36]